MNTTRTARPALTITARDMYTAQGARLSPEFEANLQARADRCRALTGDTGPEAIRVPVHDFHGALIGYRTFTR